MVSYEFSTFNFQLVTCNVSALEKKLPGCCHLWGGKKALCLSADICRQPGKKISGLPTFVGRKKKYFDGLPTFAERKKSTLTACRHLWREKKTL
jgi:hypothetical protein